MVVVSGGNGFLGAHFILECLSRDWDIKALVRPNASRDYFDTLVAHYGIAEDKLAHVFWEEVDYNDPLALREAMSEGTQLVHCAGYISFDNKEREYLIESNRNLTGTLIDACLDLKYERFVYLSSIAACSYMENVQKSVGDRFDSAYGLSKFLGELEVLRGEEEGLATEIVRPGVVLGPPPPHNDLNQLYDWISKGWLWAPTGGTGFVEIRDLARYVADLCAGKKSLKGTAVGANISFKGLTEALAASLQPKKSVKTLPNWILQIAAGFTRPITWLLQTSNPLPKPSVAALTEENIYPNKEFAAHYHKSENTQQLLGNMLAYLKSFGKS